MAPHHRRSTQPWGVLERITIRAHEPMQPLLGNGKHDMPHDENTPILDGLMASGVIYVDAYDQLIGIASDGEKVAIGNVRFAHLAERYLTDHPTPDTW